MGLNLRNQGILVHDDEWQFPAITEQNAYLMAKEHLFDVKGVVYLAFPWATLLDKYNTSRRSARPLLEKLKELASQIAPNTRVVTVCQHIHMMKFMDMFFDHKVTDIFWTHAVKNEFSVTADRTINLFPFPLYSVQFPKKENCSLFDKRKHLFSFIGARANQWYLTESRNWILDILGNDDRGLVVSRDSWHFNKIVYDYQIRKTSATQDKLINEDATEQFKQVLRQTTFGLCPSGSGPNSIRLWETIAAGSIPVILADTYLPPGNKKMWDEAVIYCEETPEAIKALPDKLAAIEDDPELLAHKRQMLGQLWLLYGMTPFIYDIQMLHMQIANGDFAKSRDFGSGADRGDELATLARVLQNKYKVETFELSMFLNTCISHLVIDKDAFSEAYKRTPAVSLLLSKAIDKNVNPKSIERFNKAKAFTGFETGLSKVQPSRLRDKKQIRVFLDGKHSNRTPLSYEPFLSHMKDTVELVNSAKDADLIVTGFNIDFESDITKLHNQKLDNYKAKHVVFSEEPLWDVVWSKGYRDQERVIKSKAGNIPYCFFNHMNSNIYAFDKIPYFITTDDKFFVRYGNLARQNTEMSPSDYLQHWSEAPIRSAFYAEIRENKNYDVKHKDQDIYGLCLLRTDVARNCKRGKIIRVGKGWPKTVKKRQALPDWHLDKLNTLNQKTMIASGLENTHQKHYITEKIFDAFSVNAVPVYFASPEHRIHEIFPDGGFINIFGMTAKEAADYIDAFEPDEAFAKAYSKSQKRMAELFSRPDWFVAERARLISEFVKVTRDIVSI